MTLNYASGHRLSDWDAAYDNRAAVPESTVLIAAWQSQGSRFRESWASHVDLDLAYGAGARERFDLYRPRVPAADAAGTVIFFHGGYWRACSKEDHAHFAEGPLRRGWGVAVVDYPLCPEASVADISACAARAVLEVAAQAPDGPLILAGHSAGGQLATWVASAASGLPAAVRQRIPRVMSLSGVHDLRPLARTTSLNAVLGLDAGEAARCSPALGEPGHRLELICACGAAELAEFRRQNTLLASVWYGLGATTFVLEYPGRHHFDVVDLLRDPDSDLVRRIVAPTDGV